MCNNTPHQREDARAGSKATPKIVPDVLDSVDAHAVCTAVGDEVHDPLLHARKDCCVHCVDVQQQQCSVAESALRVNVRNEALCVDPPER